MAQFLLLFVYHSFDGHTSVEQNIE